MISEMLKSWHSLGFAHGLTGEHIELPEGVASAYVQAYETGFRDGLEAYFEETSYEVLEQEP